MASWSLPIVSWSSLLARMFPALLRFNELLASFEKRAADWQEEWISLRAEVFRVGREQIEVEDLERQP